MKNKSFFICCLIFLALMGIWWFAGVISNLIFGG
jgi:hypothetical protein